MNEQCNNRSIDIYLFLFVVIESTAFMQLTVFNFSPNIFVVGIQLAFRENLLKNLNTTYKYSK